MRTVTSFASRKARKTGLKSFLFTLMAMPLLATGMFAASPAWAVHDAANFDNIEMDGNTTNDGGGTPGVDDWDDVFNGVDTALRSAHVDDTAADDTTVFKGGMKDTLPISQWECVTSTPQNKSNIQYSYGATYSDGGDVIIYAGADRLTNEGSANFGIWLFQQPVSCESAGGATPFVGQHLDGDLLLVAEFDQGGSVASINVYRWWDPNGIPEDGDECLGGVAGDCSDDGTPTFSGLNCAASPSNDPVCGITNDLATINTAWRAGIETNAFYEAGANLSDLIPEGVGCFAEAMMETRSSTSLTATLKDFVILDLSTCGTLEVVKETDGGSGTFSFGVSPTAGGPDTFDLMGGESQFFGSVEPNTYTITETDLPVTPEWELTDIQCVGGTPGAMTPLPSATGGFIDVDIGLGDDVVCTFTNTFTPPAGSITIEKVCDSLDDGGQTFTYALGGFGGSDNADCADGSVILACGDSISCGGLDAGDYTVDETVPADWALSDVTCNGGTSTCGAGETPHASITLAVAGDPPATESATATFTNTENAYIEICKATDPPATGGDFDFSGDLGVFALADGECSEVFSVAPDTGYTVAEADDPAFTLADITCDGVNWVDNLDGSVTITPDPGEGTPADPLTCTFTNTENPGFIQICKATLPPASPTAFTVNLTGPDADLPVSTSLLDTECDFGLGDPGQVDLTAGAGYSVSEDAVVGWDTEVACTGSGGAEDPGNIDVSPNEEVQCIFTNTQRGNIVVVKQTDPDGSAQSFDFTTSYAPGGFSLTDGQSNDSGLLVPGVYSVSEAAVPGWDLTSATCDDGSDPAAIGLDPGETVTCTFTNTIQRGVIIVEKQTLPDGSPERFDFTANFGPDDFFLFDDDQIVTPGLLPSSEAGNYFVMENAEPGWDLTSATCDNGDDPSDIELLPGQTVTCTFENTQRGIIEVEKQTVPDGSGQTFDFAGDLAGTIGDGGVLSTEVIPGVYGTTETVPAGWELTSVVCDDGNSVGDVGTATATFNVEPGETVRCVFTNTQDGQIVVEKQTLPDGSGQTFDFAGDLAGTIGDGGTISMPAAPGVYSSTETVPAGWDLTSVVCDDGNSVGDVGTATATFNVEAGESVTCVFTNTQRGTIEVEKQTDPDGSPQSFEFTGDLAGFLTDDGVLAAEVVAGTYSTTETIPAGWDLASIVCDDGNSTGDLPSATATYNVEPGETVRCVFTNNGRAMVTVEKIVQGGGDGEFCFEVFGPDPGDFCIETSGGFGSETNDNVQPGDYSIVEVFSGQYILAESFCDNGDSPGNLSVGAGDEITCTFINVLPVAVPVNNIWALLALTLMLLATGWYFRPASMRR